MHSLKRYLNRNRERIVSGFWANGWIKGSSNNHSRLNQLRNQYRGERAFLIGNGPSINKQDLGLLRNEHTFACNSFFLKGEEIALQPEFYVVEDKFVAEDNSSKISELPYPTKIFPIDLKYCLNDSENLFVDFKRYYLGQNHPDFPKFWNEQTPLTFYWGGTVVYLAIQLAVFMGFEEIYLIGIDLSYKIPENIKQDGDKLTSLEDDVNHFHPNYFGKGKRWHLPETERMQHCFERAYTECTSAGVCLFNATDGGNLSVIPRVEFATLF